MSGSLSRSIELVKESYNVLKSDKMIVLFPVLSGIACLLCIAIFLVPAFLIRTNYPEGVISEILLYGALFVFYLVTSFIAIFFKTALITCANIRLSGGDPTFHDGISNSTGNIGKIFAWALISATVGVILSIIRDKTNFIGQIIISFIGVAWNLLTYFVVPVMIFEDKSVISSIKESGQLFRKTWGESIVGSGSIALIFVVIALFALIPLFFLLLSGNSLLEIGGIIGCIILVVILAIGASALQGIYTTALYQYAKTGKVPSQFRSELITDAFVQNVKTRNRGNI